METVEIEKRRGIVVDALNKARTSVLNTDDKSVGSGKIYISSVSDEKQWFDDYVVNALENSSRDASEAFAVFGFTNMTFGLGNLDNGLVFFDDGFYFSGSGGGYAMEGFYIKYEDFVNADSIGLITKTGDRRFGKRQVVCIKIGGKEYLIDLAHSGCLPKAFMQFILDLKGYLCVREEAELEDSEGKAVEDKEKASGGSFKKVVLGLMGLFVIWVLAMALFH